MSARPPRVGGPAARAAAAKRLGAVVAILIATAAPGAVGAGAAGPAAGTSPTQGPLHFPGIAWSASKADVARELSRIGFRRSDDLGPHSRDESWRGVWLEEPVTCFAEWRDGGRLVSMSLRFEPRTAGDARRLFGLVSSDFRRRYGKPPLELSPTRPDARVEHRDLRRLDPRVVGEGPSEARFWGAPESGGAMVQLDGSRVVWARWEAPGWEPEFAPDVPAGPRR